MSEDKKVENQDNSSVAYFIKAVIVVLLIRTFIAELFFVPTGSMKQTIMENEYVLTSKYTYGYSRYSIPFAPKLFSGRIFGSQPARGDIIVFWPTKTLGIQERFIKRLIGLPGDKVQIIDNVIYINDNPVKRQYAGGAEDKNGDYYVRYNEFLDENKIEFSSYTMMKESHKNPQVKYKASNSDVFYVPEGKYFFMGDNRYDSNDSRYDLGFVPFEHLIGKAHFVVFSTGIKLWQPASGPIDQIMRIGTWACSIRWNRIFKKL